jgi:hypothetical protein
MLKHVTCNYHIIAFVQHIKNIYVIRICKLRHFFFSFKKKKLYIYTRKMSKLNRDILYSIFEELKDDKMTLLSCLLVNRTWCEIIVPIFWKDPWKRLGQGREKSLINVIISHLSDESRNNLRKFLKNSYKRPLFDYISFCKNLDLSEMEKIINTSTDYNFRRVDEYLLYKEEIFKLFINNKTKFTSLYIYKNFSYDIHLIPGAKECFSEIELLQINDVVDEGILIGLSEICKSIKKLEFFVYLTYSYDGIVKLIDAQKRLKEVYFTLCFNTSDEIINVEKSLTKHGKTIERIKITDPPITNIFPYFENLKILEMESRDYNESVKSWDQLADISLPFLQILNATRVPINILPSLIEKTKGDLKEIKIDFVDHDDTNNKRLIQAIYQNCPNLKYLELLIRNCNISEFEKLLINCNYLEGLYIIINDSDWEKLFEVLIRSSPSSLFKFKFYFYEPPKPEALKLFFDNWKGRHPMLLQTIPEDKFVAYDYINDYIADDYIGIIEKYKAEGVIKKYDDYCDRISFEDFEWIRED